MIRRVGEPSANHRHRTAAIVGDVDVAGVRTGGADRRPERADDQAQCAAITYDIAPNRFVTVQI